MEIKEAIKCIMKGKGITQTALAERLGCKQNNISMYIKSNMAIKVENLVKLVNACGYDIVLINRENLENAYTIGGEEEVKVSGDDDINAMVRRIVAEELSKRGET